MENRSGGTRHCDRQLDSQFLHAVVGSVSERDQCRLGSSLPGHSKRNHVQVPIWTVVVAVALVALTWYATQKIGGAPKVSTPKASTPDFLAYDQDSFDGLFCRWDYSRTLDGPDYRIGHIVCYCQHCDFAIGTPNDHVQECPSCSRRAVKSENRPFRRGGYFGDAITGYQRRNNEMLFEDFIRREIERRIRTGEWQRSSNA